MIKNNYIIVLMKNKRVIGWFYNWSKAARWAAKNVSEEDAEVYDLKRAYGFSKFIYKTFFNQLF